jgi:hypothetical protein
MSIIGNIPYLYRRTVPSFSTKNSRFASFSAFLGDAKLKTEISGEQSEEGEDIARNYIYNERSYKSFYRSIPIPEEIIPSKIVATEPQFVDLRSLGM